MKHRIPQPKPIYLRKTRRLTDDTYNSIRRGLAGVSNLSKSGGYIDFQIFGDTEFPAVSHCAYVVDNSNSSYFVVRTQITEEQLYSAAGGGGARGLEDLEKRLREEMDLAASSHPLAREITRKENGSSAVIRVTSPRNHRICVEARRLVVLRHHLPANPDIYIKTAIETVINPFIRVLKSMPQ